MNHPKIITYQTYHEEFYFLGIENLVTEGADFGSFWSNFFDMGGYDKIDPYQKDPNCINVWFSRNPEEQIYFQGKIVNEMAEIPEGYTLAKFPAGEYLVVTTEWLPSYEDTMHHINHDYHENAQIPDGYRRRAETDKGITLIERWGEKTIEGYRYEFWIPLERV